MSCTENLAEAKGALHAVMMEKGTGKQVIEYTYNGRSKKYQINPSAEADLRRYINELECECGTPSTKRGSIRFYG